MDLLPFGLSRFITKSLPISRLAHAHKLNRLTGAVSKQLVKEKYDALIDGKSNKDIMSLLGAFIPSRCRIRRRNIN